MKKLLFLILPFVVFAQDKPRMFASDVKILRTNKPKYNRVEVKVKIVDFKGKACVDTVYKAKDNFGDDLSQKKQSCNFSFFGEEMSFALTLPKRGATEISYVKGRYKLYTPTIENEGLVNVPFKKSKVGKNILKKVKTTAQLIVMNEASFTKFQKAKASENIGKLRDSIAKHKDEMGTQELKLVQYMIKSYEKTGTFNIFGAFGDGAVDNLYLKKIDKDKRVVSINVFNAKNEKMNNGSTSSEDFHHLRLKEKFTKGSRIVIELENQNNIELVPFELKNIFLP